MARNALSELIVVYNDILLSDPPQSEQQVQLYYDTTFTTSRQRSGEVFTVNQSYVDTLSTFIAAGPWVTRPCTCVGVRDAYAGLRWCVACVATGGSAVNVPEVEVNSSEGYVWEVLTNSPVVFNAMNQSHFFRYTYALATLSKASLLSQV